MNNNSNETRKTRLERKVAGSSAQPVQDAGVGEEGTSAAQHYIVAQQTTMAVSGPLPHSTEFASYNQTLPGAADRILVMAEREQEARLFENRWLLGIQTLFTILGQGIGAMLVYKLLTYAYDLALHGREKTAIAFGTSAIGAILAAFIVPRLISSQAKSAKQQVE